MASSLFETLGHRLGLGDRSQEASAAQPPTVRELMESAHKDKDRLLTQLEENPGDPTLIEALNHDDGALAELHRG